MADPLIFGKSESKETHDERSDEIPASPRCAATHARGRRNHQGRSGHGTEPGPTELVETLQQVETADGNRWEKLQEEAEKPRAKVRWFVDPDVPGTPTGFNEGEISEGDLTPPYTPFIDELRKPDVWLAAKDNEPRRREFTEGGAAVVEL